MVTILRNPLFIGIVGVLVGFGVGRFGYVRPTPATPLPQSAPAQNVLIEQLSEDDANRYDGGLQSAELIFNSMRSNLADKQYAKFKMDVMGFIGEYDKNRYALPTAMAVVKGKDAAVPFNFKPLRASLWALKTTWMNLEKSKCPDISLDWIFVPIVETVYQHIMAARVSLETRPIAR